MPKLKANGFRILVYAGALWPLVRILWNLAVGRFLVDPVRETMTLTGRTALNLLVLSLACTPVYTLTGFGRVLRARRTLGLYAFLYAALHFLTFVGWDYSFDARLLWQAVFYQQYVVVGFLAGLILLVLAVTSIKGWRRRLGKRWKRIQRLVYLADGLAVLHFAWLLKAPGEAVRYGVAVAMLFVLRLPVGVKVLQGLRRRFKKQLPNPTLS